MNKKRLCALTALTLAAALTLCACGKKTETTEPTDHQSAAETTAEGPARTLSLTNASQRHHLEQSQRRHCESDRRSLGA